ncbi:MAG TPA: DUF4389 domain-containing protein [Desulfobaccales bacterium]
MNDQPEAAISRAQIAIRLLYTVFFMAVFCILKAIILLTTAFQFVCLFITLKPSEPVRRFANQVVTYAYRVWRYITLNENRRPFPFSEFDQEIEAPDEEVSFP